MNVAKKLGTPSLNCWMYLHPGLFHLLNRFFHFIYSPKAKLTTFFIRTHVGQCFPYSHTQQGLGLPARKKRWIIHCIISRYLVLKRDGAVIKCVLFFHVLTERPSRSNSFPNDSMTNCCRYRLNKSKLSLYGKTTISCSTKHILKCSVMPRNIISQTLSRNLQQQINHISTTHQYLWSNPIRCPIPW